MEWRLWIVVESLVEGNFRVWNPIEEGKFLENSRNEGALVKVGSLFLQPDVKGAELSETLREEQDEIESSMSVQDCDWLFSCAFI